MNEREYVETIRKAAEEYLEEIHGPGPEDAKPIRRWYIMKQDLSPHTAIALCDAWLTMQEAVE